MHFTYKKHIYVNSFFDAGTGEFMIYSGLFLEKNEKLMRLFLITYKNNLLVLYAFCICCHWFYEKFNFKN